MKQDGSLQGGIIIYTLRYKNAAAAVEWLRRAFAFEPRELSADAAGQVFHAELVYGNGMVMLGQARDDEFGRLQKPVADIGGVGAASPYVIVPDADAHHARALAAGARIVMDLYDADYGGRGYGCLDLEGNLWNFGTYNPWHSPAR